MKIHSKRKAIIVFILLSFFIIFLASCETKAKFTVYFNVDGNNYHTIATDGREILEMPANPIKEGFEFDGWYLDQYEWKQPFTDKSVLEKILKEDIIVYAKWNLPSYIISKIENTYTIVKYTGNESNVKIPENVNQITVNAIADKAFKDCTEITNITIPDSVTIIGKYAFNDCPNLTIYCEVSSKPSGWDRNWNNDNRLVIWEW